MFNIYCYLVEIYVRAVKEIEKKSAIQVIVTNMKNLLKYLINYANVTLI